MPAPQRPKYGIAFDLVGDTSLKLTLPTNCSRRMIGVLLSAAEELGTRSYVGSKGEPTLDDHVPLANVGLEVLNIIDLDYRVWHTSGDSMEQVSADRERLNTARVELVQGFGESGLQQDVGDVFSCCRYFRKPGFLVVMALSRIVDQVFGAKDKARSAAAVAIHK